MFAQAFQSGTEADPLLFFKPVAFFKLVPVDVPDVLYRIQEEADVEVWVRPIRPCRLHQGVHERGRLGTAHRVVGLPAVPA